jgi:hypothetical protein
MRSSRLFLSVLPLLALAGTSFAQTQDASPVDVPNLLRELKAIREKQVTQVKTRRQSALQTVQAAAANGERAAALWQEAIKAIRFDGAPKEGALFGEWKDKEGDGLNSREARNAARLYFTWLSLTMQRDAGATTKDLLLPVIAYTKELSAHQQMVESLEEEIKKDKELAASKTHGTRRAGGEGNVKKMNDQILKDLAGSPVVQWMKLQEFVTPEKWTSNPGDADAIFTQIVLPELRAQKDPRVLEYWDLRLKKEADAASKAKLVFDVDKFNNQRRPALLWRRAQDQLLIGQRNRAMTEMFGLIKNHPQHPEADDWIANLEATMGSSSVPAAALPPPTASAPAIPEPAPAADAARASAVAP